MGSTSVARVALVKGSDRYANVRQALELIADDIDLKGARRIVIKPNFTSVTVALAATHRDAVRAVLDFLKERTSSPITIAEGSGSTTTRTMDGFRNFGYLTLKDHHNLRFVDLNQDETVPATIFDSRLRPLPILLAKTMVEADYRVSVCPLKTHDCVIVSAALKNMVMGSLVRRQNVALTPLAQVIDWLGCMVASGTLVAKLGIWMPSSWGNEKAKIHQGYPAMNLSLYRLARTVPPHLAVIDGFQAMEDAGPVAGKEVRLGLALASTDFVAADTVAARLMGFPSHQIGYLSYCARGGLGQGNLPQIEVVGDKIESCARTFKPHPTYKAQLQWQIPGVERYL